MDRSTKDVPKDVIEVLLEFKGIMADEILMRSISHQIDLIQGSSLPNNASDKMTLTENVELNQQV